jgi:hypothetical protein
MKHILNRLQKIGLLLTIVLATGCATTQPVSVSVNIAEGCDAVNSKKLTMAFEQSRDHLARSECAPFFDQHFNSLRRIATGDPKLENRAQFAGWLSWASKQGVITVKQSKEHYNRYFNETFVSLPKQGHICGHIQTKRPVTDMTLELTQKREGYLDILGDSKGYNQVHEQYQDMKFMLESMETACQV